MWHAYYSIQFLEFIPDIQSALTNKAYTNHERVFSHLGINIGTLSLGLMDSLQKL